MRFHACRCLPMPADACRCLQVLEGNTSLQRLDLRRNTLGVAGLMAIHIAMKTNTAMLEVRTLPVALPPQSTP